MKLWASAPAEPAPAPRTRVTTCEGVDKWYAPILVTAGMIGERSLEPATIRKASDLYDRIQPDDYVETLRRFYGEGLTRFGDRWRYADLVTGLFAAAELVAAETYLEIGVRRGRSMAAVVLTRPDCRIVGFDYWKPGYAGMENPGPEFVKAEMARLGHTGSLELVTGNSHETVPAYLKAHPDAYFDLITVDGDHTPAGAADDLKNVLPRLKVGGAILFDDISHPTHPELKQVWASLFSDRSRYSVWEYTDLGYGVGIAVRKR